MRQDWIEFKTVNGEYGILRPEYITSAVGDNKNTTITYDDYKLEIMEPYEQVKQKIMDAEKVDLNNVMVKHFTREEYEYILQSLKDAHVDIMFPPQNEDEIALYERIKNKLNKILKEKE